MVTGATVILACLLSQLVASQTDRYSYLPFGLECERVYKCDNATGKYVSPREISLTGLSVTLSSQCYSDVVQNIRLQVLMILNDRCADGHGSSGSQLNISTADSPCFKSAYLNSIMLKYTCNWDPVSTLIPASSSDRNDLRSVSTNTFAETTSVERVIKTSQSLIQAMVLGDGDVVSTTTSVQSSTIQALTTAVPVAAVLVTVSVVLAVLASRKLLCFKGACSSHKQAVTIESASLGTGTTSSEPPPSEYYADILLERHTTTTATTQDSPPASSEHEYYSYNARDYCNAPPETGPQDLEKLPSTAGKNELVDFFHVEPPEDSVCMVDCDLYVTSS